MNKTIIQTKITTVQFSTKEIIGTEFSKWYINKIVESDGQATTSKLCGIARTRDIENWNSVESPNMGIKVDKAYRNYAVAAAISKTNYELMRQAKLHITDVIESVTCDNIDDDDYLLFLWNVGSHQLFDFNEMFVEIPINLSYLDSINNARYDLDAVLNILRNSPYAIGADKLIIERIPYYNATEHSTLHIPCNILLSKELYQKYEEVKRQCPFRAKRFVVHEILGLVEKDNIEED